MSKPIVKAVTDTIKDAQKPVTNFAAGLVGLWGGNFVLSKIPDLEFLLKIPVVGKFLSKVSPGLAIIVLAILLDKKFKNQMVESGAFALGLVGFTNILKRLTADAPEGSIFQKVNAALPVGLGGVSQGHSVNAGHYPASYFIDSKMAYDRIPEKTVSGLGNTAYSLEGQKGSDAFKLEGFGRLGSANAFMLEGRR